MLLVQSLSLFPVFVHATALKIDNLTSHEESSKVIDRALVSGIEEVVRIEITETVKLVTQFKRSVESVLEEKSKTFSLRNKISAFCSM